MSRCCATRINPQTDRLRVVGARCRRIAGRRTGEAMAHVEQQRMARFLLFLAAAINYSRRHSMHSVVKTWAGKGARTTFALALAAGMGAAWAHKTCPKTCQPRLQQPRCDNQRSTQRCTPPRFPPFPSASPQACGLGTTGTASAAPSAEAPRPSAWRVFSASLSPDPPSGCNPQKSWQIHFCQLFYMRRVLRQRPKKKG